MPKTNIDVELIGENGNAFAIIGKVTKALRREGEKELAEQFQEEAMSGDYNHLLRTCMEYVEIT